MCLGGGHIRRTTSLAYTWIHCPKRTSTARPRESWSKELGVVLTDKQWERACILAHKCSLSTRTQETSYKLLTQWYATPAKLHKWFPQTSELCWRCEKACGFLYHIWWECPLIASYWSDVGRIIWLITDTSLTLDAACCLLHVTTVSFKLYKNSLYKHLLSAAKALIPLFWKSTKVPSIRDWIHRIRDILYVTWRRQ